MKNPDVFSLQEQQLLQNEIILAVLEDNLKEAELETKEIQAQFLKEQQYSENEFASKLKDMQEYTKNFGSLFEKPEMFNPLFEVINKALGYLNETNKLSWGELLIKIRQHPAASNIDDGTIMQIHDLITRKNKHDTDEIIAGLEEMNRGARKSTVTATHPLSFEQNILDQSLLKEYDPYILQPLNLLEDYI